MLSGGREDPLYPRPSELYPRPSEPGLREAPCEPRSSVRPIELRPDGSPDLPGSRLDSEDERGGMGENFCQPPPLVLPRDDVGLELPGLAAAPELLLVSVPWLKP
jgi:hypothetical protein